MESYRYNDRQNKFPASKQKNLYALPSSDNGSTEVMVRRNGSGAVSDSLFRNVDTEISCPVKEDLGLPEEKQSGNEDKQEIDGNQDMLKTIAKLRYELGSAVEQVHDLQDHVALLEQEKTDLEKRLKDEIKKNTNSEAERLRQRQHVVPVLQNEDKQEELRIYPLEDSPENKKGFYVARRQKATVKKMERSLLKKHPKAALIAHREVPNSVNTFNFVVENAEGIERNVNYFTCTGNTSEVCQKFDEQLVSAHGKRLKRHQNGELYKYFPVIHKEDDGKVKKSAIMPLPAIKNKVTLSHSPNTPANLIQHKKLKTLTVDE